MNIPCCNCMEPWHYYHLMHDLSHEDKVEQRWKFGSNLFVIKRCACCSEEQEGYHERLMGVELIADVMGDDLDGMASELDSFPINNWQEVYES